MRIITVLLGILAVVALTTGAAGAYLLSGELNLEREQRAAAETRAVAERLTRIDADNAAASERIDRLEAENAMGREIRARIEAENSRIDALNLVASEKGARIEADNRAMHERGARIEADNRAAQEKATRIEADNRAAQEQGARIDADNRAAQEKEARGKSEERAEAESAKRVRAERAKIAADARADREKQARVVAEEMVRKETARRLIEGTARLEAEREAYRERSAREDLERELGSQQIEAKLAMLRQLAETQPVVKAILNGKLTFYFEPVPYYAAEGVDRAVDDIETSLSSWNSYGATLTRVYNKASADITVSWVRDYGSHTLGEALHGTHIKVGLGSNNCLGKWMAFDTNIVKKVLWHELGHSMGYEHSRDPANVMYSTTATRHEVEHEYSDVIAGGWYHTLPLCGSGKYTYSFEAEGASQRFEIRMLPPEVDPDEFSGDSGRSYNRCGGANLRRFSSSCNVSLGSVVYLANNSYTEAVRVTGLVVAEDLRSWPDMVWDPDAFSYNRVMLAGFRKLLHDYRGSLAP